MAGRDPVTRTTFSRQREVGGSRQLERRVNFRNSACFLRGEAHRACWQQTTIFSPAAPCVRQLPMLTPITVVETSNWGCCS